MSRTNTMFEVVVLSGLHAGAKVQLDGKSHIVVGRDMACDIMLRDKSIADRHLMFVLLEHKLSVVALTETVAIDGQTLASGKTRTLRNGARIVLGDVSIAIGEPGIDANSTLEETKPSLLARSKLAGLSWLSAKPLHLKFTKASVLSVAVALTLTAITTPLYQWWTFPRIVTQPRAQQAVLLRQALAAHGARELTVTEDINERNLVVAGHVSSDADRDRLETAITSTRIRPIVRIYSGERIEQDVRHYIQRYLPSGAARVSGAGIVSIGNREPLRPQYQAWLTDALLRDVPGLLEVRYDGPSYSSVQEVLPAPYSIVAIDNLSFLIDSAGERYFSGAILAKDIQLRRLGRKTIFVERLEPKT
ncbi:FHA domain-containing protein [Burkholderia pyrrocinia]